MKFKLDENLPELARESLSELGHDAHTVAEEGRVRAGVGLCAVERVRGQRWVIDDKRVRIRDGDT